MPEAKFNTQSVAADGSPVTVPVVNYCAEKGPWPFRFQVPKDQAGRWLQHLGAECGARGWGYAATSEMTSAETSGSITVSTGATVPCSELIVVWRRRRDGAMPVRARPGGTPPLSLEDAHDFIRCVDDRSRSNSLQKFYRRGQLHYQGLPWLGELWLDDALRLGPPSRQYERTLIGPRIILVDAVVEAVDAHDAGCVLDQKLRELAVFLSVVMRTAIGAVQNHRCE